MYTGDKTMKKLEYVTFRTTAAVKELLEQKAKEDDRTISYIVEKIVQDWAQNQQQQSQEKN